MTSLDHARLKNLFAAIEKAVDACERLDRSEDPLLKELARSLNSRLEDMSMEIGMELADGEDKIARWITSVKPADHGT
jgi:hypothetical protein